MKHLTSHLAAFFFLAAGAIAQPSESVVKARYMKDGVTAVKITKTVKEWDGKVGKYYWKVNLVKTQPVAPAEVDGLKGITLETHVLAGYDIGASSPYWAGVVYSEYKGIDLPTPTAAELTALLQKGVADDPSKFFRSQSGKIGIDKVWSDDPQPEWVNPKALNLRAKMLFKEDVSYTEIARIEAPILVSLKRTSIKGPWSIDGVLQQVEEQKELERTKKTDAGAGAMSMADRTVEKKNQADAERLGVPAPIRFASIEAMVNDIHQKLFTLSREQFDYYLIMMMQPELRCTGCVYTPTANGNQISAATLVNAYDVPGTFRNQFCSAPNKLTVTGSTAYFFDRKGGGESYIMTKKIGEYYYLDAITLKVTKDAAAETAMMAMACAGEPRVKAHSPEGAPLWTVGASVMVEENGKWYPSSILKAEGGRYYIHYDGYAASYDTWVTPERIKSK